MRTALEVGIRAGKAYGADRCAIAAAGITYYALIALFPLLLFSMSVAGFVFDSQADQQRLVDNLMDNLPLSEGSGRDDLEDIVSAVVEARGALGIIGLVGTAYSASALFSAVRLSLVGVFKVEKRRPFVMGKAVDLAFVLGITLLLLASVAITFTIAFLQRFAGDVFGTRVETLVAGLLTLAYPTLPALISFAVFWILYRFVTTAGLSRRNAVTGALVATVLFEALKIGFAQYLSNFGNYNATYGTLGAVIALLAFFNLSAQVMLAGAEVARARRDLDADSGERRETHALLAKVRRFLRLSGGGGEAAPAPTNEEPAPPAAARPSEAVRREPTSPPPLEGRRVPESEPQPPETPNARERPRVSGRGLLPAAIIVAALVVLGRLRRGRA